MSAFGMRVENLTVSATNQMPIPESLRLLAAKKLNLI